MGKTWYFIFEKIRPVDKQEKNHLETTRKTKKKVKTKQNAKKEPNK